MARVCDIMKRFTKEEAEKIIGREIEEKEWYENFIIKRVVPEFEEENLSVLDLCSHMVYSGGAYKYIRKKDLKFIMNKINEIYYNYDKYMENLLDEDYQKFVDVCNYLKFEKNQKNVVKK